MLPPIRSLPRNHVISGPYRALCAPTHSSRPSQRVSFSTHPTAKKVSVFLPHEQLTIKSALKSPSLVADHHDLASYLSFHSARLAATSNAAKRAALNSSSVFLGTRYEYLIQRHLQRHLGFDLTRVGGRGDGGVDLIGTWSLPGGGTGSSSSDGGMTFRVLLQAKRLTNSRKPMPALMRELEGTMMGSAGSRALGEAFAAHCIRRGGRDRASSLSSWPETVATDPEGQRDESKEEGEVVKADLSHLASLGILITTRALTDGIEKAMAASRRPLMYIYLEESSCPPPSAGVAELDHLESKLADDGSDSASSDNIPTTKIRQIAWNAASSRAGLQGYGVTRMYVDDNHTRLSDRLHGEATILYQGQPARFVKQTG